MPHIRNVLASVSSQMTTAFRQMAGHVLIVFLVAFVGVVSAGLTGSISAPTLLALLIAGGSAGLTAVVHYLLGLVPAPIRTQSFGAFYHVPPVVEQRLLQVLVSMVATFLVIAGTAALAGTTSVGSIPTAADLIVAAISAGLTGVVQYVTGLLPERLQAT